jgi:hypothetical protein
VKELTEKNKERILAMQANIQTECQAKATETESHCRKNIDVAVKLVFDSVVGEANER